MLQATLDFETFWAADHSLSKMSPMTYVMHPRTELISCAIKINDYPTDVFFGEDNIAKALSNLDWSEIYAVGHNMSGFDAMILAWRLGIRPKMWGCTLAMARPIHGITVGNSLAKLVEHYGLGVKDAKALHDTKGKGLADFTADELDAMKVYNRMDVEQCYALFNELKGHYSAKELWQIDATIRMLVEPKFHVDRAMLETALSIERDNKRKAIGEVSKLLGVSWVTEDGDTKKAEQVEEETRAVLASAPKFAALLQARGVPVPMKDSPTNPDKQVPALAKTDEEFIALKDHEDPVVAAAAQARLAVKSTLLETRIGAFLEASGQVGGKLPVPLNYCGATTTGRWSGWAYNPQNLPRIGGQPKVSDALRNCMRAPKGYKVVVADLSGIELRVNHFLWKVPSSVELFKSDAEADLYRAFAAERYNITPQEVSKAQRQLAKIAQLGLGFGAGWSTFQRVAKLMGGLDLPDDEAQDVTASWRKSYKEIVAGWRTCHAALDLIHAGETEPIDPWGLSKTCNEGIRLPSGRLIRYPGLHEESGEQLRNEWWYGAGRNRARIYAGKVTENCLAGDTLVLTNFGWKPIANLLTSDLVHDGVEFVRHDGVVFKSVQACIELDGVWMTPDHEVLTYDGWKEASQVQRPYRPDLRDVDCTAPGKEQWKDVGVEVCVPMWAAVREVGGGRGERSKARRGSKLRVRDFHSYIEGEQGAWDEQAPGIRGLAVYVGQVQAAVAPVVGKLRRAWNNGVQSLAGFVRQLLGGHGGYVQAWVGLGQGGQRWALLAGELPLGNQKNEHNEQAHNNIYRRAGVESSVRDRTNNDIQPHQSGLACGQTAGQTRREKQVFDILNCGPRSRFVVRGDSGPLVVHNCVQALARDIIAANAFDFWKLTRLRPSLTVHDELVYVVPETEAKAALDELQKIMRTPPKWWPELVVWSEGDIADTYGAAK